MSGSIALESTGYLDPSAGRPEFQVRLKRGLSSPADYHVVGLQNGLLLLNIGLMPAQDHCGALGDLGGRVGRVLGEALDNACETTLAEAENNLSRYSDQQLIALARESRGNLIALYDDADFMTRLIRGGAVGAVLSVREKTLGKMKWEVRDHQSLLTVCEFLPAKLGERVTVNLKSDPRQRLD